MLKRAFCWWGLHHKWPQCSAHVVSYTCGTPGNKIMCIMNKRRSTPMPLDKATMALHEMWSSPWLTFASPGKADFGRKGRLVSGSLQTSLSPRTSPFRFHILFSSSVALVRKRMRLLSQTGRFDIILIGVSGSIAAFLAHQSARSFPMFTQYCCLV